MLATFGGKLVRTSDGKLSQCCCGGGGNDCPILILFCNRLETVENGADCAAGPDVGIEYWFEILSGDPFPVDFTLYWSEATYSCNAGNDPPCVLDSTAPFSFSWSAGATASDHFIISATPPADEEGNYTEIRVNHDPSTCCPPSTTPPFCCWCNPGEDDCDCAATPATGACCLPDLTCISTTATDCTAQSGTYQGDDTSCSPTLCCPPCTAHVHVNFSIDFDTIDGTCTVSTSEDHTAPVSWIDCDFTSTGEKFDLIIPLTSATDDPPGCFGASLSSAYYEVIAFYDTSTGWDFTYKIHLGAGSFDTGPDAPPGFGDLDALGTISATAYGGVSSVFFTCP